MTDQNNSLCLSISHHIFLSKKQRYDLARKKDCEIVVTGFNIPVWCDVTVDGFGINKNTSEPAEEIFCSYYLDNKISGIIIESMEDGYRMHFSSNKTKTRLLDPIDKGVSGLQFNYSIRGDSPPKHRIVHFVQVEDIEILKSSINCNHLMIN